MAWTGNQNNKAPNIGNVSTDYSNTVVQHDSNLSEKTIETNRAREVRRDVDKQKDITIGFYDIDTAISRQLEKFQLSVTDNGQNVKVPIYYASPEKWKSIQVDGYMRDYNGKIILPAIVFSRTTSNKDETMRMFNRYLKYTVMKRYDPKNRYTPFNLLIGQNVPINDVYGVVMPDHMLFTYHFIIWAGYQTQVNKLVERFNFESEDYWGEKRGYRFRVKLNSVSHTVQVATDQDRMVKAEFDLEVNGYLLPDVVDLFDGKENTTQKWITPKKVIMGEEIVASHVNIETELEKNAEKWRNQNYPNLRKDDKIPSPPIVFSDIMNKYEETTKLINKINIIIQSSGETGPMWTLPPPISSDSPGAEGNISYDSDYYYIYTNGQWKKVPISL